MAMTNKFLLYDLNNGGFMLGAVNGQSNNIQHALMFTEQTATESFHLDLSDQNYLQIPLTQDFVDALPFDIPDSAPDVPHSAAMDVASASQGDFVVLTDMGFYDEKYNSLDNTSHPKVRGFDLDYANLYSMDKLKEMGTEWIMATPEEEPQSIIVPVSKVQQEQLAKLDAFSPEKEPHGFFMEPIGDTQAKEADNMLDLGDALEALEADVPEDGLPFEM